jgi:hypothetical protein
VKPRARGLGAGLCSVLGPGAFATAAAVGARREPGYVTRDRPISALAAHGSQAASIMVPGFLALGGAQVALGRALRGTPAAPDPVPTMVTIAGLTTIGAGLARCSDPSCPTRGLDNGEPKPTDDAHVVVSAATFALWIATPLVAARRARDASRGYRRVSALLGLGGLAVLVGGSPLARSESQRGSGWAQRAMLVSLLAWQPLAALAPRLRRR